MKKGWILVAVMVGFLFPICSLQTEKSFASEAAEDEQLIIGELDKLDPAVKTFLIQGLMIFSDQQEKLINDLSDLLDGIFYEKVKTVKRFDPERKVFKVGDAVWFNDKPVIVALDSRDQFPDGFVKNLKQGLFMGGEGNFVRIYIPGGNGVLFQGQFLGIYPRQSIIIVKNMEDDEDEDEIEEENGKIAAWL